ncbi:MULTISPECIES: ATP phosphoribosyltransferase regulatory subunit [Thiomicrorhabdus]|uniref:ATP phosphoribosyltransferase regulatory subunit n=1 Tax=Thiomicrorhabdus heinhorstiae TaxID=2748010 RepID=A0ABS0BT65_9GAMM|nr:MULTISPECIES: ATP phosphoribosyltransferase regulatory subunit [Thiomicrorhabdus]MBF6056989.1 ATP phosphoribosyltransferase regulatory subunit [Thiomicrorhabdus heinhorstiae]
MQQSTWFTPEGLEDLLPPQAQKLEYYRRKLLDGFTLSGYELVLPPIAEYTDALLTGTARHLAIDTCRFTDQESGRMMGVRADMTPQVARIVSNRLKAENSISRLCYVGEVLKTRNNKAKGSRSPIQVGAELFGHSGVESDLEIIELMLESLTALGMDIKLSLGHVGIVDELMALAGLSKEQSKELIDILERKAIPEYQNFIATLALSDDLQVIFNQLPTFCGDADEVISAAQQLKGVSAVLDAALDHLTQVIEHLNQSHQLDMHLDLADIRGYQYHNGMIFAAYNSQGYLLPIAKGGRYDGVGKAFGLALPATGFSLDLRASLDLLNDDFEQGFSSVVYAPSVTDGKLQAKIAELKAQGLRVVRAYTDDAIPQGAQQLVSENSEWILKA